MDDDLDDYELFWSTIVSHFRLLSKSVVNLSQLSVNLPTVPSVTSLNQWTNRLITLVMRPQSLVFVALLLILAIVCHTFEYWLKSMTRSTINLIKRLNFGLSILSTILTSFLPNVDCISRINDNVIEELKDNCVGIYAIQGRRHKMEDKFTYVNDTDKLGIEYWAVFDGHGGDSAAIFVESKLYKSIANRVEKLIYNNSLDDSIDDKSESCAAPPSQTSDKFDALSVSSLSNIVTEEILSVDKELIEVSKSKEDVSGSTALIALRIVSQNKLIVANVGDSRGVICDSKGSTIPLSFDHKPNQLKEHKRIKEAGGFIKFTGVWRVAGILATSRAMGDYPLKDTNLVIAEPDILTFDLNDVQPKFMILASDGLWDTLTNEEAVNLTKDLLIVAKRDGVRNIAHEVAKNLVNESYKRGSVDNITVILVIFDNNLEDISN